MIRKVSATWGDVPTSNRLLAVIIGQRMQFKREHMAGTRMHGPIRLLKRETRSCCRTPGRTRHADGLPGGCASVSILRLSSPRATTLPRKPGPSARHAQYAASAWPTRSPLMSGSASGAVLIPGSGAPCAGGWSGVDRPHRQKPGPLRDPGTAAAARQDRRERPVVTADGPR